MLCDTRPRDKLLVQQVSFAHLHQRGLRGFGFAPAYPMLPTVFADIGLRHRGSWRCG
jgi:hypothetical protein